MDFNLDLQDCPDIRGCRSLMKSAGDIVAAPWARTEVSRGLGKCGREAAAESRSRMKDISALDGDVAYIQSDGNDFCVMVGPGSIEWTMCTD